MRLISLRYLARIRISKHSIQEPNFMPVARFGRHVADEGSRATTTQKPGGMQAVPGRGRSTEARSGDDEIAGVVVRELRQVATEPTSQHRVQKRLWLIDQQKIPGQSENRRDQADKRLNTVAQLSQYRGN